jgi:TIR domain
VLTGGLPGATDQIWRIFTEKRDATMIIRNGKVFISHAVEDEALYAPLVARLTQKDINVWSKIMPEDSDTQLSQRTRREIASRDVFIRICTPATARSERMRMEAWAFQSSRDEDTRKGTRNQHIMIDLVMDPAYTPGPGPESYLTIDTTSRPMNDWLVVLYNEMGKMQAKRAMSRRTMTIVVSITVIAAFLLVLCLLAFFVLFGSTTFFIPAH